MFNKAAERVFSFPGVKCYFCFGEKGRKEGGLFPRDVGLGGASASNCLQMCFLWYECEHKKAQLLHDVQVIGKAHKSQSLLLNTFHIPAIFKFNSNYKLR